MYGFRHGCSPRTAERRAPRREEEIRELHILRDPTLRVSDGDRERTVRALSEHTAAGLLTLDEFEERVGAVYTAQRVGELEPLLADLPQTRARRGEGPAPMPPAAPADWGPWRLWLLVGAICLAVWAMTSIGNARLLYFWPIWVIGPWGVSMLLRGVGNRGRAGHTRG
jgi:hypothetical protein